MFSRDLRRSALLFSFLHSNEDRLAVQKFLASFGAFAALVGALAAASYPAQAASGQVVGSSPTFGGRVNSDDRISVEVVGRGPDVVLISGIGTSRETWRASVEALRSRYRLHLVQLAGFAGEPARANASGPVLVPAAEAIDRYITGRHLAPAVVVGHSAGGSIALWLAENRPQHIRKLMIVDALPFVGAQMVGPTGTSETVRPVAEQLASQLAVATPEQQRAFAEQTIGKMATSRADVDRIVSWRMASSAPVVARAIADDIELDLRPGVAIITAPVTVAYAYDPTVGIPEATVEAAYKGQYGGNPKVKLLRFDGSRHFIMLDKPQAFASALATFLTDDH